MTKKVKVGARETTISIKNYLTAGGQASIYKDGNELLKIYHDQSKMIPVSKIKELSLLKPQNVIKPLNIVYDAVDGSPLGYSMVYLKETEPLCKFFTLTFKQENNIDNDMVIQLVKSMQLTVSEIHNDKCLVVDLNELNILVDETFYYTYFIDCDSYQTPNHRASAIMLSIKDPKVISNHFTDLSDWFSWGILSIQLYINIHPYKGSHPKYKPNEWAKRMTDGISIFDKHVKLPRVCNPFSVIPKRHLDWFKDVFEKGNRSVPPLPDSIAPMAVSVPIFYSNNTFEVLDLLSYPGPVLQVLPYMGVFYVLDRQALYANQSLLCKIPNVKKTLICPPIFSNFPILAYFAGMVSFEHNGKEVGKISSQNGGFQRNNCIYTVANGRLIENSFIQMGFKVIHRTKEVDNVSILAATVYDGCIIQDLLGKKYVTIPYTQGRCANRPVPGLDGFRVVEAKSEKNVCVIIAEQKNIFYRFILTFARDFSNFVVRLVSDVVYENINFTVMDTGVTIMVVGDELEVFQKDQIKVYKDPPLTANMRLFNHNGLVYFVNGNSIHQLKIK